MLGTHRTSTSLYAIYSAFLQSSTPAVDVYILPLRTMLAGGELLTLGLGHAGEGHQIGHREVSSRDRGKNRRESARDV